MCLRSATFRYLWAAVLLGLAACTTTATEPDLRPVHVVCTLSQTDQGIVDDCRRTE